MCGLVGRFAWSGPVDPEGVLPGLVNQLAHRGPDEGSFWRDERFFFGHRRLSIIDLAQGGQPMASPDGALVVAFNGEIYNYIELREELGARGYPFRTSSDTEVLLHGYREWGTELPARLVGMFAFAIADRTRGELFLARDRFGEKPLLYCEEPGTVTFASELRPLAALPGRERRLDEAALGAYLCLNYVPGDRTLLEGVARVPPGSWRLYSAAGVRSGEYWAPPRDAERSGLDLDTAVAELRQHLDQAVRWALRSDVPVGIFLSGGMDSSLIAESAARQGRLARAYCLDFADGDWSEGERARAVADRLAVPLTRVVLEPGQVRHFLALVEHADDPLADAVPAGEAKLSRSYQLMRFLRASLLPSGQAHFTWNGVWLPAGAARLLRSEGARRAALEALEHLAARHGLGTRPDLGALQRADLREYLPNDILAKVDRMSMAHGLEVRAPFLQPALAAFALSLPATLRCGATGRPKRVLRELARRLYGDAVADAPKQGFSIPIHTWLRGPARALVEDLLAPAAVARIDALDADEVARVVDAHLSGRRAWGWEVWGLMVLSAWHQARIVERPPAAPAGDLVERRFPRAGRACA